MHPSEKNRRIYNMKPGDLILANGKVYEFKFIDTYMRGIPQRFQFLELGCEGMVGGYKYIDLYDMRHSVEFLEPGTPQYATAKVLYGSK